MTTSYHIADVLAQHLASYKQIHPLSYRQKNVCEHIQSCRTAKLGQQLWRCDHCYHTEYCYCSCRDRHCPRCQAKVTTDWCTKQSQHIVNAPYFHLVFTLPHELNGLAQQYPKEVYQCLFKSTWATLKQFAIQKKALQGELGMTAVLHTWGQSLAQHIHLHCLIPGGVLTKNNNWKVVNKPYLFHVKALAKVFRAKVLAAIRGAGLTVPTADVLMSKQWSVYSKACLSRPELVIKYLGRYTQKGMIHESRLKQLTAETVSFSYKDYQDNSRIKKMTLSGVEFIRRYLLHILPKGFMRIRHYGILASACREKKLALIRKVTQQAVLIKKEVSTSSEINWPCPICKQGLLLLASMTIPMLTEGKLMQTIRTTV